MRSIPPVQAHQEIVETEWGGHARGVATVSEPGERSIYQFVDTGTAYDGQAELRLKNRTFFGSQWSTEVHYELVALGGDTLERDNALRDLLPADTQDRFVAGRIPDDSTRLMDLTRRISTRESSTTYHRLDRLNLNYAGSWGSVRIGRQALTWGDGQLFNPMDLFNPFSPTTVQRDYKTGDDMAHVQVPLSAGNLQALYVPRRDPRTGDVEQDRSSTAAKWHYTGGALETDLMLARHYSDDVAAVGASGYLGGAVWRTNAVYTRLEESSTRHDDYIQFIANMDYSWVWGGKNIYGTAEFYYNGLGVTGDYASALSDPAVYNRLERGELFTLGKRYLAGSLQIEWHPLVQLQLVSLNNIDDPSGVIQPQVIWDMSGSWQLIAGGNWNWGGDGTEFGGFDTAVINGISVETAPTDRLFVWLTRYF